ncbi:hypothetical protein CASFOL_004184 [Castilleja foliolosa]|uniref:GTD-binding domain-containing protein n=1 Tax=Castilleja foliolosa TaxID=1961234 RepID=A0ABD3EJA4_9LAMI
MAPNKFATILHRNTNKITLILIYALLEWVLILLLLFNSLFSYLIIKFAHFFGLKPPCPWCTRLGHIFGSDKNTHTHLICEFHKIKEISSLGFCSNHLKLVELQGMCEDCLSGFHGFSNIFRIVKEMVCDNIGLMNSKCCCCCCGVRLDDNLFSTYLLLKTLSWDVYECAKKENLLAEAGDIYGTDYSELCADDENVTEMKEFEAGNEKEDEVLEVGVKLENVEDKAMLIVKDKSVQACVEKDLSSQDLEFCLDCSGNKSVAIESFMIEDHVNVEDQSSLKGREFQVEENEDLDMNEEPKFAVCESMEMEEDEDSLVFHAKDCHLVIKGEKDVQETDIAAGKMSLDIRTFIGTEESVDASVASEVISDGVVTIERLKSALRAERKALEVLYAELEEERNASEVAANQTMAMINRLQEEKAAIQMEAIQYQRLMEEQSEYDQQTLQILNELMVDRENENQELEKELEFYKSVLKKHNFSIDVNQEFDNQDNNGFEECL